MIEYFCISQYFQRYFKLSEHSNNSLLNNHSRQSKFDFKIVRFDRFLRENDIQNIVCQRERAHWCVRMRKILDVFDLCVSIQKILKNLKLNLAKFKIDFSRLAYFFWKNSSKNKFLSRVLYIWQISNVKVFRYFLEIFDWTKFC